MMKVDFYEFAYLWFRLQNLKIAKHQVKMVKWLFNIWKNSSDKKALLMAFRNSGKSTIVGLFCTWVLYMQSDIRILVIAADYSLAKKMVKNVKNIIEKHPLSKHLKPSKLEQWASDQFIINREVELRDPSMLAKGLSANLTGLRADLIICDDVEVPNNCDNTLKRLDMREKLSELDYIISPNGMQLYIGTPHSFYTIYKNKVDVDNLEEKIFLEGFKKLEIPILDNKGNSVWKERFSLEKIASIRQRSGENKFLSQMMLKPISLADSTLDPTRLVSYQESLSITYANDREILKIGEVKMVSASCWWDPSFAFGENSDSSVVACVFTDEKGGYWLHDIEYIKIEEKDKDNIAVVQCEIVIQFLSRNFLSAIHIETNGIGKFLPSILKKELKKNKYCASVLEAVSSKKKELRILEAFEVLLASKGLNVSQKIWQTKFIEEMREWGFDKHNKDDALDAVAGCLLSEPIRISGIDFSNNMKAHNWQGSYNQYKANVKFEV